MRRTLRETMQRWQWDKTWGWDYPMTALTAARLGETSIAIDALMMQTEKNRYLPNLQTAPGQSDPRTSG